MSLRDVDAIDYIGVNILFKRVYVGLFDDLDWHDQHEHQELLTKKIDRYIRYIRSGQLIASYPKVRGYEIAIEYVSMHTMTPAALEFWKSREHVIRIAGFAVRTRGVDVRRALGIEVAEPEALEPELVEPPAIAPIDAALSTPPVEPALPSAMEVLDADPESIHEILPEVEEVSGIAYLPPRAIAPRRRHNVPVLTQLVTRRTASM